MKKQINNLSNKNTKFNLTKKLFVLCVSSVSMAYAADTAASMPVKNNCSAVQAQVAAGRELIEQGYANGDGCTIGNQEVKNHKIIQANLSCFPNFRKNDYNLFHVMDELDTAMDNSSDSSCEKGRATVMANHQKIKNALVSGNGCTAGKLQVQNYSIIKNNPKCFSKFKTDTNVSQAAAKYDASAAAAAADAN